ncbi:MAG: hypothetical protein EOM20_07055 [Spartobacteria bacterium]|nr:hypothetical protein [Spartobacteria bacterium]
MRIKWKVGIMLVVLGWALTGCQVVERVVDTEERPSPSWRHDSGRLVMVHYFNWFETPDVRGSWRHWEWLGNGPRHDPRNLRDDGHRDIASVYYPLIGPYDASDRDVIEYHVLSALAAKIDGFFVDWYGIHSDEERALPALLDMAARCGFKVGICFEDKTMFGYSYNVRHRHEAVSNAVENLNYILDKHAAHPAYLHLDGKPVVITFSWSEPMDSVRRHAYGFFAHEWAEILDRVREKHDIYFMHDYHSHLKEQYWDIADNMYPWLDVNGESLERFYAEERRRVAAGQYDRMSSLVYPGFDNHGVWGWGEGPFVTPREDGDFYRRSWEMALSNDVRLLQIATWNDFAEGATIEPTVEYGFQYLELTEAYVARFKGLESDSASLRLPYEIYRARKAVRRWAADDPEEVARLSAEIDAIVDLFQAGQVESARARLTRVIKN